MAMNASAAGAFSLPAPASGSLAGLLDTDESKKAAHPELITK